MRVSGFTFLRNAIKKKYPAVASIKSILPIVDEFIVNICDSQDGTVETIRSINSNKIKIISSPYVSEEDWIYARATNLAYFLCSGDWCFYIQGDEVLPEWELDKIYNLMKKFLKNKEVEGILFNYIHFWATPRYYRIDRGFYRKEIRIIRSNLNIISYKDAQGFRLIKNGKFHKIKAIDSGSFIFHYGFVFKDISMERFYEDCDRAWLKEYDGKHPKVLEEVLLHFNREFNPQRCKFKGSKWVFFKNSFEIMTKLRLFEYKPYKLVKNLD
jgi:hypothetical protein